MEDVKGVALNGASDDGVEEAVELVEEAPVQAEGSGGGPAPPADDDEDDGGALPVKGAGPPAAAAEEDEAGEAAPPVKAAPLEIKQQKQPAHGSRASAATSNPLGAPKAAFMSSAGGVNPDAELVRASDPLDEVRSSPVRVTDLSKQLKEQFESGGSATNDAARQGEAQASRSASGAALTQHDLVNTANVALVLQAGGFKLRPGIDVVPYDQLKELRLEDGLDVSRKEEYLSDAEFEQVFGIDKEEFKSMPAWKRINAKKSKGLF